MWYPSSLLKKLEIQARLKGKTVTIWIPNTWLSDSSEYWTEWLSGFQMVKSHDLADHLNTRHFGPWTDFLSLFSDHHSNTGPFDNQTQIYHLNTRLVWYSDGYCKCFFQIQVSLGRFQDRKSVIQSSNSTLNSIQSITCSRRVIQIKLQVNVSFFKQK